MSVARWILYAALGLALPSAAIRIGAPMSHGSMSHMTQRSAVVASASEAPASLLQRDAPPLDAINDEEPLHVLIAGAGVGGLGLANCLAVSGKPVTYTILERTKEFKKFGGPIQLASNAMENIRSINADLYDTIEAKATWTGNRTNGIKDGIRDEWYAKFDLATPAAVRGMPFTCVVDRPDLQDALLERVDHNMVYGAAIASYENTAHGVTATLQDGRKIDGDILVGADGIWSNTRAQMHGNQPAKGDGSGVTYSGYTVFAGELYYDGGDPECGYKVYIGPQQYFVITDIGRGRYQWYAFLARAADSQSTEPMPDGASAYLQGLFEGWSPEALDILKATQEHEIEQRDLYDRPPSVFKPWTDGRVALLGDSVHAMMPNLGQGGCQAIEDASVLSDQILSVSSRAELESALGTYRNRRLARSATVQGLSRFASDIIIQGFDTPAKVVFKPEFKIENFNYAGIVTRLLQPILPVFFSIQFNFLYSGWRNERFALEPIKDFFVLGPSVFAGGLLVDSLLGGELIETVSAWGTAQANTIGEIIESVGQFF